MCSQFFFFNDPATTEIYPLSLHAALRIFGPVIDDEARRRILATIEEGKKEARLVYAGDLGFLVSEGTYVAPHIFADVAPNATIAQEEIFGPVLAVLKARNLDEALQIANGTPYALTAGIYSRTPATILPPNPTLRLGNL